MTGVAPRWRRATAFLAVVSLLLAGLVATVASAHEPALPTISVSPPDGNHDPNAVNHTQTLSFEGEVDHTESGSYRLHRQILGHDGSVLQNFDITALVEPDSDGSFSGTHTPNYDCGDPCRPVDEKVAAVRLRLRVSHDGSTREAFSNELHLDHITPSIREYRLIGPQRIEVRFSEPVWHSNPTGDHPADWCVQTDAVPGDTSCHDERTSGTQTPLSVEGSGGVRYLNLGTALGQDATPRVDYRPSVRHGTLAPYEDRVQWDLDLEGRDQLALDRIPPPVPDIDHIAGTSISGEETVHGRDPKPQLHVTNVTSQHRIEIRRDAPDGLLLGDATACPDGQPSSGCSTGVTITLAEEDTGGLGEDGAYRLVAVAQDPSGNRTPATAFPTYVLDRVPPAPIGADADGDAITVSFSEGLLGTDAASQWTLSNGQAVTQVTGAGHLRELQIEGRVPPDVTLAWDPGDYRDRAGNAMAAFSGLAVVGGTLPPPPFIDTINGQTTDGTVVDDDPQPTVHVTDIDVGWEAEVFLGEADCDSSGSWSAAAGSSGAEVQVDLTGEEDGTYFLGVLARSGDTCVVGGELAAYRLDTTAPTPVAAVADGDQVVVHLSEDIFGTDGAGQWSLSDCGTDCRLITDVTGSGNQRVLQANGSVQEGWTLDWIAPLTGEPYADEAGNELTGFPIALTGDPPPFVRITSPGDVTEGADTHAEFSVELTRASDEIVTVTWETVADTATSPGDYEAASGVLAFGPGATTECSQGATTGLLGAVDTCTVAVELVDDDIWEETETFHVDLTTSVGAPIDDPRATATILDDEDTPGLRVQDAAFEESDDPHRQYVIVRLVPAVDRDISFDWATADGSATAGEDYRVAGGRATIPAGNSVAVLPVDILGDTDHEPDEAFTVQLSNVDAPATVARGTATITILNDDPAVPSLSIGDVEVTEGDTGTTPATFTVTLSPHADEEVRVDYATSDDSAVAPGDYGATSGTLVFPPGDTSRSVTVSVVGDTAVEPDETFTVDLSAPSGAPIADGRGVGTIVDDDGTTDDDSGAGPHGVFRYAGPDRYETAADISRSTYADGAAPAVVLARGDDPNGYADALAGTPFAVRAKAPLLITPPSFLHTSAETELKRVLERGREVVLLGGVEALSTHVEQQVQALGFETRRIAGVDRMATAVEIARELGDPSRLLVARGFEFPDALTAGAAAAHIGGAVLLSHDEHRTETTESYLRSRSGAEVFAVGGHMARLYGEAEPVFGADRIGTARAVADRFFSSPTSVGIARSDLFPDSLAGGAHIGRLGGPMLLTQPAWVSDPDGLADAVSGYLCDHAGSIASAHLYGGTHALSAETEETVRRRIEGRGC